MIMLSYYQTKCCSVPFKTSCVVAISVVLISVGCGGHFKDPVTFISPNMKSKKKKQQLLHI